MNTEARPTTPWPMVALSEVADMCLGKMLDAKKNKGRPQPYLRNPNVQWFDIDLSNLNQMRFEDHEEARYGLQAGDVLICEGGQAGRAAIWDGRIPGMKFQKAIHRVRCGPRINNRYLVHRLMADYASGRLADYYTGATIKHLTGQDLARYRFPLPPIPEQQRIVDILDKSDALRAKRRRAVESLDGLRRAIYSAIFERGEAGQPLPKKRIGGCVHVQIGPFGSLLHRREYVIDGVPLINPQHIQGGAIVAESSTSVTAAKAKELGLYSLRASDVIMGRRGEMGRCAVVNAAQDGYICGTGSVILRPDKSQLTSQYLAFTLSGATVRRQLEAAALGVTLPNLNRTIVEDIEIPVPELKHQTEFAARMVEIDAIGDSMRMSETLGDELGKTLRHKAFHGAL